MSERRRSATIYQPMPNIFGWEVVRFEFGPWWWRWWLVVRHGGKRHRIITGEPCVVFDATPPYLRAQDGSMSDTDDCHKVTYSRVRGLNACEPKLMSAAIDAAGGAA